MTADISAKPKVSNVNFKDAVFFETISNPSNKNYPMAKFNLIFYKLFNFI